MASVHRQKGSPCWVAHFYDREGRRRAKSTKIDNLDRLKDKAQAVAEMWEEAEERARKRVPSAEWALQTVNRIFEEEGLPVQRRGTWTDVAGDLLAAKRLDLQRHRLGAVALRQWERALTSMGDSLGKKAGEDMQNIRVADCEKWYDTRRQRLSSVTLGHELGKVRAVFARAQAEGLIQRNPILLMRTDLTSTDRIEREIFTQGDVSKMLAWLAKGKVAHAEEWRTMILLGLCTGARLHDCAKMRAPGPDGILRFKPGKKGRGAREVQIPVEGPLARHLQNLQISSIQLCPALSTCTVTMLSRTFIAIMDAAGIGGTTIERTNGRSARLKTFHSFRHTLSTLLAEAGVDDLIARQITDHENKDVADIYRHVRPEALRTGLKKGLAQLRGVG